ncbi:MAG: ABC transmembrane type-1 domain-containing protein [Thermocaproicibacter melissae]|uniref:carbohydrate ABC transporter permease n=1 Tax=Thermocaproicibacter melissae TaxID=2966552 RepID=UPI003A1022BE
MTNQTRKHKNPKDVSVGNYIFLIIVCIISVFPLFWMFVASTNKSVDVVSGTLIPGTYIAENYKKLIAGTNLWTAMWNSFKYSVTLTFFCLVVCSLAGYGFEVYHDKAKDRLFSVILLAMMVPLAATMIPLYQMCSEMGLLNTTAGFILPTISTPFMIMLFRQNSRSFPHDIIEASRIDGLGELQIFLRMYIPTQKSTFAAAMTIAFMNAWNSYLWPKVIMLKNDSITMPMLIAGLKSGYVTDYGVLMLAVLFCTLPTVLIFFVLQKQFAQGITGAVK